MSEATIFIGENVCVSVEQRAHDGGVPAFGSEVQRRCAAQRALVNACAAFQQELYLNTNTHHCTFFYTRFVSG
jgi:hypothetical protein